MADPALDELDSRLGPVVHRIAWDAGLLKIRSRLLAGTTNLAAGAQACDSFENVASELNIFEGFSLEIVKCEIKVAKVENDHGNFGEAKVQFQAVSSNTSLSWPPSAQIETRLIGIPFRSSSSSAKAQSGNKCSRFRCWVLSGVRVGSARQRALRPKPTGVRP